MAMPKISFDMRDSVSGTGRSSDYPSHAMRIAWVGINTIGNKGAP